MLHVQFDPWAPEVRADPYPFYSELRRESPCLNLPGKPLWVVRRCARGSTRLPPIYEHQRRDRGLTSGR